MRFVVHPQERSEPVPVIGHMPTSIGASEPLSVYRYHQRSRMLQFVVYWIGELADYATLDEHNALILCHQIATEQAFRRLHANEAKLLSEAVRDVIGARQALQANPEWLSQRQSSHVGEAAS